jgi:hypothetical protein
MHVAHAGALSSRLDGRILDERSRDRPRPRPATAGSSSTRICRSFVTRAEALRDASDRSAGPRVQTSGEGDFAPRGTGPNVDGFSRRGEEGGLRYWLDHLTRRSGMHATCVDVSVPCAIL